MKAEIFLDTARLGRMCPGARRAEQSFARLVSQLGSSLYLEQFLLNGYAFVRVPVDNPIPQAVRQLLYLRFLLVDALFLSFTTVRKFSLGTLS